MNQKLFEVEMKKSIEKYKKLIAYSLKLIKTPEIQPFLE